MIGIYKITNKLNGKSYIGQSIDIKRRWAQHKANIGSFKNPLYLDFEKYGLENFDFEVIENCEKDELDSKEIFYISKFDSFNNGYNLTTGGQFYKTNDFHSEKIMEFFSKKLSSKQWQIYYYLLLLGYKRKDDDNSAYLSKRELNVSKISKDLKISRSTFYAAIKVLEENDLIRTGEYGCVIYYKFFYNIDFEIFNLLFNCSKEDKGSIDILRLYFILKIGENLTKGYEKYNFTRRRLVILLGHNEHDAKFFDLIDTYLKKLVSYGLVKLSEKTTNDENIGCYTLFFLENIKDKL